MKTTILQLAKMDKLKMLANRAVAKGHRITPTRLMIESLFLYNGTVLDTDTDVINFCKSFTIQ
ncbi:hypothetical protein [Sphingobacterium detergens]|uniref:hypothetical protein n=1 Tax=Sphingobacterium detergens TaxID=1145106 RepID=UPI003AAE58A4